MKTIQSVEIQPMTLTKANLTNSIRKGLGLPKSRSSAVVGSLFQIMKATLANGEDILIADLRGSVLRTIIVEVEPK